MCWFRWLQMYTIMNVSDDPKKWMLMNGAIACVST